MLLENTEHQEAAVEHGSGGADFIMHHILAHKVIKLPTIAGIDFSITNHILMMFIASILLIAAFVFAFRKKTLIPKGLANALESLVQYIYNEAILSNMGSEGRAYAPFLLTAFFFILVCNFIGLVPYGATATGNISMTTAMALMTLVVGQFAGMQRLRWRPLFDIYLTAI